MSLAQGGHSPLSPPLPDAMSTESEQNLSVSCSTCSPLAFVDNHQVQNPGSDLLSNAQNVLITGDTFVLSLFAGCIDN